MTTVAVRPRITSSDRLVLTLCLAIITHGIMILGITFSPEDILQSKYETMEIILVSQQSEPVKNAETLAQADLEGGGDTDERVNPSTPLPPPFPDTQPEITQPPAPEPLPVIEESPEQIEAMDEAVPETFAMEEIQPEPAQLVQQDEPAPEPAETLPDIMADTPEMPEELPDLPAEAPEQPEILFGATENALEQYEPTVAATLDTPDILDIPQAPPPQEALSDIKADTPAPPEKLPDIKPETPAPPEELPDATSLLVNSLEIASLSAELDRKLEAQSQRPRRKFISASTKEYKYAAYMEAWRAKVERIGNLNYPDAARKKNLSGSLILDVALNKDGSVNQITVRRSSGYKILDEAAIRIVKLSGPFAPLPEQISAETDILHITRTWQFLNNIGLK